MWDAFFDDLPAWCEVVVLALILVYLILAGIWLVVTWFA